MESGHGLELRSDLGIWPAAYSIAVRRPPYWRISSIDKFTLLEEGGRIPFSIVFAAKARTGVDHVMRKKLQIRTQSPRKTKVLSQWHWSCGYAHGADPSTYVTAEN
jgi:hypothetical protein